MNYNYTDLTTIRDFLLTEYHIFMVLFVQEICCSNLQSLLVFFFSFIAIELVVNVFHENNTFFL